MRAGYILLQVPQAAILHRSPYVMYPPLLFPVFFLCCLCSAFKGPGIHPRARGVIPMGKCMQTIVTPAVRSRP